MNRYIFFFFKFTTHTYAGLSKKDQKDSLGFEFDEAPISQYCIFLPLSLSVYIIKYKYLSIHKMYSVCVYIYLISVISNLFESSCGGLTIILRDYKSVIIRTTKWEIKIFIEILYRYLMLYGIHIGTYNDINSKPVL